MRVTDHRFGRGRSGSYLPPPAQIPACGFSAPGSCRRSDATDVRGLGGPSSSGPWAHAVGNMPVPALCPGHALVLALPSTDRLPSTLSAPRLSAGVVRGFIGTIRPSDSSYLPIRLRLLTFPNRPGIAVAMAGSMRSPRFRRVPFERNGIFDHGRAVAPRMTVRNMLPSTFSTVSAPANLYLSVTAQVPQPIDKWIYFSEQSIQESHFGPASRPISVLEGIRDPCFSMG